MAEYNLEAGKRQSSSPLSSRFARVRVRASHHDRLRDEEWLPIEWPEGEAQPVHYWLSTLPQDISFRQLVSHALGRWMSERDYEELKSELGLSQYEGRNWRGFHHHATLCIAAYAFLMLQRLRGKKTPLRSNNLPYPKTSGRAGLGPMQRHNPVVDRQHPFPSAPRDRADVGSLPLLRETVA